MSEEINQPTISESGIVRPTKVIVSLSAIKHNFKVVRERAGAAKIMAILKANAYGHGLVRIAQLMEELDADAIGVAFLEEGILLRRSGITKPILVLGGVWGNQIPHFLKHNLMITASSIEKLRQIDETASALNTKAAVHLKIDTGLERIGVHYYNSDEFLAAAYKFKNIKIEGIYSHFADSFSEDLGNAKLQVERFEEVLRFFEKHSIEPPTRHIANSGAIIQMPETAYDMVRPGIMLYGVYPGTNISKTVELKPALEWKSLVVYFKVIKAGSAVGYGSTWAPDHNIRAVTVPVGYGDGYFKSMSGKAKVIISGERHSVIGVISMDQIVANIENGSAYNGDEVILLGSDGKNEIRVEELAGWAGTIPYEILTNINTRVPRVYID